MSIETLKAEIRELKAELADYPLFADRAKIAPRRNAILEEIAAKEAKLAKLRQEAAPVPGQAIKSYEKNVGRAPGGGAVSSEDDPDRVEDGRAANPKFG